MSFARSTDESADPTDNNGHMCGRRFSEKLSVQWYLKGSSARLALTMIRNMMNKQRTMTQEEIIVNNSTAGWLLSAGAFPKRAIEKKLSVRIVVKGDRTEADRPVFIAGKSSAGVNAALSELQAKMEEQHQAAAAARADRFTTKRLRVGSDAVRWLLSHSGENIQELRSYFHVSISVKGERAEVRGRREDVDAALAELKDLQALEQERAAVEAVEARKRSEDEALCSARRQAKQDGVDTRNWEDEDFGLYWKYHQVQHVIAVETLQPDTEQEKEEEIEVEAPQIVVAPVIRPGVQELEPKSKVWRRKVRLVSFSQFGVPICSKGEVV